MPPIKSKELTPQQAQMRCEVLCARSEQSSGDIMSKLTKWGIPSDTARTILQHLVKEKYVDDERYARAYVRDKFRYAGWGRLKIAYNLRQKGVDRIIINEAMETEIEVDEYADLAERLLRAKWRDVKSRPSWQARAALLRYAAQRGFESDVSVTAVEKVLGNGADSDCYDE